MLDSHFSQLSPQVLHFLRRTSEEDLKMGIFEEVTARCFKISYNMTASGEERSSS